MFNYPIDLKIICKDTVNSEMNVIIDLQSVIDYRKHVNILSNLYINHRKGVYHGNYLCNFCITFWQSWILRRIRIWNRPCFFMSEDRKPFSCLKKVKWIWNRRKQSLYTEDCSCTETINMWKKRTLSHNLSVKQGYIKKNCIFLQILSNQ